MRYTFILTGALALALPFVRALAVEKKDTAAILYSTDALVEVEPPSVVSAGTAGAEAITCAWGFTENNFHGALRIMTAGNWTRLDGGIASIALAPNFRFQATKEMRCSMKNASSISIERTKRWAGNLQDRMFWYRCINLYNGSTSATDTPTGGSAGGVVLALKRFLKRVLMREEDDTTQMHDVEPSTLAAIESVPVEGRDDSPIRTQDDEVSIGTHNTSSVIDTTNELVKLESLPVLPAETTDVDVCGWGWTEKNYKGTANYMQADGRWYQMPDGGMWSYYFRGGYRILATDNTNCDRHHGSWMDLKYSTQWGGNLIHRLTLYRCYRPGGKRDDLGDLGCNKMVDITDTLTLNSTGSAS